MNLFLVGMSYRTAPVAVRERYAVPAGQIVERDAKLLREINHALSKLDDGTYGYCEGTDELIGRGRLRSRPWTRYSVAYKEEIEVGRRERRLVGEVEY